MFVIYVVAVAVIVVGGGVYVDDVVVVVVCILRRMGKNKVFKLPHFYGSDTCRVLMLTHAPDATTGRAAGTGLVNMSTRPDIPGTLHLEREARDWSTYNEYSYRLILLLLLYVYCSHARPHSPFQFRRRRLQDFFYL